MSMPFIPDNARLRVPPNPDERVCWDDYRGTTLSDITLTTYCIRRRLARGASLAEVTL